jgi:hypothetical protein
MAMCCADVSGNQNTKHAIVIGKGIQAFGLGFIFGLSVR